MSRCLLHKSKLEDFKAFLDSEGIQHRPGKGDWQALQVCKDGKHWNCVFNEAVNAVQRLSEGQPFEAIVIADAIKRATAQYEQTIAQQAEQLAQLTSRDLEVARTIEDLLHSKHSLIEQLAAAQRDAERWDAIETLMLLGNIELEQEPDGGYSISVDPIENITPFGWIGNTPEEVVDKAVLKFKSLRPGEAPIDAATAAREDVEQ